MQPRRLKGRPKLPANQRRKFSVHVTVTADERQRMKHAAAGEDVSVSTWARRLLLRALGEREA